MSLEKKFIFSAIFLDVAQGFGKVWHEGLVCKLNKMLPKQYAQLLTSYISNRLFRIKQEDEYSELREISAGVPQSSVLGPVFYLLFRNDHPRMEGVKVATFADDTALLAVGSSPEKANNKLQQASNQIFQ